MFRACNFAGVMSHVTNVGKSNVRFISFLKMKETFKHLIGLDSDKLPYDHVCQIGDPVLRGRAMMVEPEVIKLPDFQKVL